MILELKLYLQKNLLIVSNGRSHTIMKYAHIFTRITKMVLLFSCQNNIIATTRCDIFNKETQILYHFRKKTKNFFLLH